MSTDAHPIEAEIQAAFKNVTLESGFNLRQAKVAENYGEPLTAVEFSNLARLDISDDWKALSVELLGSHCTLAYFDDRAFRYYIPAFMLTVLHNAKQFPDCVSSTISSLRPTKDDLWDYHMHQYSLLDTRQRAAIAHFLQALPNLIDLDYEDNVTVERALDTFWYQYL